MVRNPKESDLITDRGSEQIFFGGRHINGQQVYKRCSTSLITREIQTNHNQVSPHVC